MNKAERRKGMHNEGRIKSKPGVRAGVIVLLLFIILPALSGVEYNVAFFEGFPVKRSAGGSEQDLDYGDIVKTGDTVITHKDEFVELQSQGQVLKIREDTVFTIFEKEPVKGKKTGFLACLLGKIQLTVDRSVGEEPNLATNSAVCGVRGTDLELLAGADGSSLIVVLDGLVAVEAGGVTVELAKGEGVEVTTGSVPGEKFRALDREIDFSTWDQEKLTQMLADPVQAALNIEKRLNEYIGEIQKIYPLWLDVRTRLEAERAKLHAMKKQDPANTQASEKQYYEVVQPLALEYTRLILNIRYYALSALSLKRFVLGRLYLQMKAIYIMEPDNANFINYLTVYNRIIDIFENIVARDFLVKADI